MGCVREVIPWVVDPIGMAIQKTTGFNYTPGGIVNRVLNPPRPTFTQSQPPPPPRPSIPSMPGITISAAPPPPVPPPPPPWRPSTPAAPAQRPQYEGATGGASTDRTRGLIVGPKRGTATSLLR